MVTGFLQFGWHLTDSREALLIWTLEKSEGRIRFYGNFWTDSGTSLMFKLDSFLLYRDEMPQRILKSL